MNKQLKFNKHFQPAAISSLVLCAFGMPLVLSILLHVKKVRHTKTENLNPQLEFPRQYLSNICTGAPDLLNI